MNNLEQAPKDTMPNLSFLSFQRYRDSKLAFLTRKDLETQLIAQSFKHEAFKQELLANPKAVMEKELGTKLPEEIEIKVIEETVDTLYMVVPSNPYEEISEEQLTAFVGITYEDVAECVMEQQRNTLLDEASSVEIIAEVWRDEAFKQKLLHDPIEIIEQTLGNEIQKDIKIQVFAETAKTFYIVIPSILENFDAWDSTAMMSHLNLANNCK